jgi:hypothetical protein
VLCCSCSYCTSKWLSLQVDGKSLWITCGLFPAPVCLVFTPSTRREGIRIGPAIILIVPHLGISPVLITEDRLFRVGTEDSGVPVPPPILIVSAGEDFSGEVVIGRFVDVVWCVCHTYIVQYEAGKARDARDFSDILLKKTPPP